MSDASIPPTKRQRTAPQPPISPPLPPPPEEEDTSAPLPADLDTEPPPPPPEAADLAQNSDIVPPPPPSIPPPPPPDAPIAEEDEEDVQDAAYWTRLAQSSSSSATTSSNAVTNASSSAKPSSITTLAKGKSKSALYLDTINRSVLDFDFEKLCSISLSNINVYACLVCGRYFQGRGRNSYAYLHSIDDSHHVFLHLGTAQAYILPDNYAVPEENMVALQDIKYLLNPRLVDA